jgi:hypothetical protein
MSPGPARQRVPQLHPMRSVGSARSSVQPAPHHRLRVTIDHEPLRGVTPAMLLWWFGNLGGEMPYAGGSYPRYLVWHPLDHRGWTLVRPAPDGTAGEGARVRIREDFGADPAMAVDSTERVEKLDDTGIRLVVRVAGAQVFQLEHTWSAGRGRTHYTSVLDLGSRSPLLRPVNSYLRRRVFRPGMEQAWIKHNIEEVGLLEHFLPALHRREQGGP